MNKIFLLLLLLLLLRRSKKTFKLRVTGRCFPAQRASKAENVPIWWRHHVNKRLSKKS